MHEQIFGKFNTALIYDLRICIKEDDPSMKNIKRDQWREIISSVDRGIFRDLTQRYLLEGSSTLLQLTI